MSKLTDFAADPTILMGDVLQEIERRLSALETPSAEDLPYPALLENERRRFAEVMAENVRLKAELKAKVERADFFCESISILNQKIDELEAEKTELLKDAELGRLVRAMPQGVYLLRSSYEGKWCNWRSGFGYSVERFNTPEEALRAAGVSVEEKPVMREAEDIQGRASDDGLKKEEAGS